MPNSIQLKVTQAKKGPTSRLLLAASCYGYEHCDATTSETFVIDDLVKVRLKVKGKKKDNYIICMSTMKHELAKGDAISMNVTCNALKYSKKMTCYDIWSDWIYIGVILTHESTNRNDVKLSLIEILINVYITKLTFPKLYEDSDFTDFKLSTPDGNVAVHRAVLAAHSPVFKTMLAGTWKETKENLIEIKDYTLQTAQHLKDFMYLGTLPSRLDELHPLMTLADLYSIDDLKKECVRELAENVLPEDLYSLHEFACTNNIPELSYALTQLTLDKVVDLGHQIKKRKKSIQFKQTQDQ